MRKVEIIARLQPALEKEADLVFAYLFGSAAADELTPISDIDLAVYPARKFDIDDRLGLIQRLMKHSRMDNLDLTFFDRLQNLYLLENIIDHGIVLLDRDRDQRDYFEVMAHHRFLDFQYQLNLYMED